MSHKTICDACGTKIPVQALAAGWYVTDHHGTIRIDHWHHCSARCAATTLTEEADRLDTALARNAKLTPYWAAHNAWLRLPWWKRVITPEPKPPEDVA